jgi:hypothetical protein
MSYHAEWIVCLIQRRNDARKVAGWSTRDIDRVLLRHVRAMFNGD